MTANIDGDHSYEGALQDWKMYAPLVRKGGLIAFHDILTDYHSATWGHVNVRKVWEEVKADPSTAEFWEYVDPDPNAAFRDGIGVIRRA
jgi:cephalosporin hydroxylase